VIAARAWAGRDYAVLGLARSGLAVVDALRAAGARVVAWDGDAARVKALRSGADRLSTSLETNGDIEGRDDELRSLRATPRGDSTEPGQLTLADPLTLDLNGFAGVVVSPGVPVNTHPIAGHAARFQVPLIGDIELFAEARAELPAHKVVGITGTNGKSTTTALIHHIVAGAGLPALLGGNIGLPILGEDPLPEGGVYVLELSSYQIDLTASLDCDVAVLLNITPDHLDRYAGFDAYAHAKERLFEMQRTGLAVIASEDEPTRAIAARLRAKGARLVEVAGADVGGQARWPALQGPHNAQNVAAAVAACAALGIPDDAIEAGLASYPGLPHRMERVATIGGVLFVNDSKATNPTSTAPALAAFPRIRWILGGRAKTPDLDACAPYFDHVRSAYTIGEAGPGYAQILSAHMPVSECGELAEAVRRAASDAEDGDAVLLSPACASFDQFRDYEARGAAFRAAVGALA
jgi:UDP-N-acetylmuramoylalanine--D-glutamate ligase